MPKDNFFYRSSAELQATEWQWMLLPRCFFALGKSCQCSFSRLIFKSDYKSDPLSPPKGEAACWAIPLTPITIFPEKKGVYSNSMNYYRIIKEPHHLGNRR
jgi:hypothetical protein